MALAVTMTIEECGSSGHYGHRRLWAIAVTDYRRGWALAVTMTLEECDSTGHCDYRSVWELVITMVVEVCGSSGHYGYTRVWAVVVTVLVQDHSPSCQKKERCVPCGATHLSRLCVCRCPRQSEGTRPRASCSTPCTTVGRGRTVRKLLGSPPAGESSV